MDKNNIQSLKISSIQDYLEKILMISKEKEYVRSIDLANKMQFSKASISIALKKLKEDNFILINEKGHITLTNEGLEIANKVLERHINLTKLFVQLGINKDVSNDDACKIEHIISEETYLALKGLIKDEKE